MTSKDKLNYSKLCRHFKKNVTKLDHTILIITVMLAVVEVFSRIEILSRFFHFVTGGTRNCSFPVSENPGVPYIHSQQWSGTLSSGYSVTRLKHGKTRRRRRLFPSQLRRRLFRQLLDLTRRPSLSQGRPGRTIIIFDLAKYSRNALVLSMSLQRGEACGVWAKCNSYRSKHV